MNLHLSIALRSSGRFPTIGASLGDDLRDGNKFWRLAAGAHDLCHRLAISSNLLLRCSFMMEVEIGLGKLVGQDLAPCLLSLAFPLASA